MELPFGIRDGLSSSGDFNASSQFYQARHGKSLIGGYLSRVSSRRLEQNLRRPVLRALMQLSQGQSVAPALSKAASLRAPSFARETRILYVVVDRSRASQELLAFATRIFNLEKVGSADGRDLYLVRNEASTVTRTDPPAGR